MLGVFRPSAGIAISRWFPREQDPEGLALDRPVTLAETTDRGRIGASAAARVEAE